MTTLRHAHPELAAEWAGDWNAPLTADQADADWRRQVHWRCRVDPSHVWRAGIRARVNGDGPCPFCWEAPASKKCMEIAGMLLGTFAFDPTQHKIALSHGRGADDVDILIPNPFGWNKTLVIEFDSHFTHKCRSDECEHRGKCPHRDDRAKTIRLQRLGYVVVRIREEPLDIGCRHKRHHRRDIYVAKNASAAVIAARLLERIR